MPQQWLPPYDGTTQPPLSACLSPGTSLRSASSHQPERVRHQRRAGAGAVAGQPRPRQRAHRLRPDRGQLQVRPVALSLQVCFSMCLRLAYQFLVIANLATAAVHTVQGFALL